MKIKIGILLFLFLFSVPAKAQPSSVQTIREIINGARGFDGKSVVVRGEAIGHVMPRGDFAWVNVEDATGQIGIWLPLEEARKISHLGNYHTRGDIVEADGIFFRADPGLEGETVVRARQLTVVSRGDAIPHEFNNFEAEASAVLLIAVMVLWIFREMIKRRRRAGQ